MLAPPTLPGVLFPNVTRDYSMDQEQDTWAVFGSLTWNLSDRTRLTPGLRYSEENKKVDHALQKSFTGGWDYSALAGLPAGTLAFGNTAAEYDRFVATAALNNPLGPGLPSPVGLVEGAIFAQALGTFEHDIQNREREEQFWNWSLTMEHDLSDDVMLFAGASTGTKGGGFDGRFLRRNSDPFFEYEEEKALNYELGAKSTLLDGAMTLNVTAFHTTIEDFQVSIFDGATAFFVQNAAEIESQGVELDLKWLATDGLTVSLAGSYLDNKYTDFPNAPCWAGTATNNRGDCIGRGTPLAHRDASGDPNSFAPEWAFNLNFDYRQPIGAWLEARAVLNINYSDEYFVDASLDDIYSLQEAYTKYDARLSLGGIDGDWDVALIGKNLTNELTSGSNNDQPLVSGNGFASTDRLRSYAVQATYRF
jgi:outer membrane receptor protein involved in Fe transport